MFTDWLIKGQRHYLIARRRAKIANSWRQNQSVAKKCFMLLCVLRKWGLRADSCPCRGEDFIPY